MFFITFYFLKIILKYILKPFSQTSDIASLIKCILLFCQNKDHLISGLRIGKTPKQITCLSWFPLRLSTRNVENHSEPSSSLTADMLLLSKNRSASFLYWGFCTIDRMLFICKKIQGIIDDDDHSTHKFIGFAAGGFLFIYRNYFRKVKIIILYWLILVLFCCDKDIHIPTNTVTWCSGAVVA